MRRSRKFCQRGSNFDFFLGGGGGGEGGVFFFVGERWVDPNTTISGPSSARQQNAILMAFPWRADDGPTLNAGSVAS